MLGIHTVFNQTVNCFSKQAWFGLQPSSQSISLQSNSINSACCVQGCCAASTTLTLNLIFSGNSCEKVKPSCSASREMSVSSLDKRLPSRDVTLICQDATLVSQEESLVSQEGSNLLLNGILWLMENFAKWGLSSKFGGKLWPKLDSL